jgi:ACS family hexuronate transporter-like MFS transporter
VPHRTHDGFEKKRGISLDVLIRDLRVWGVVLARLFGDSIWFFYAFWLPDYLSRVRGFSMSLIGLTAWIPFLMGGVGNLMGGWISGLLIRRGMSAANARLSVILVSNAIMSMGIAVGFCNGPIGAIILISFVVFACCSWAVNILTLPSDLFAPDAVATTVGFSGAAAGLGGMLTTLLAGKVIDHYSYKFVFLGLGLLPICSGLCSLLTLIPKRSADPTPSTDWDGLTPAVED